MQNHEGQAKTRINSTEGGPLKLWKPKNRWGKSLNYKRKHCLDLI